METEKLYEVNLKLTEKEFVEVYAFSTGVLMKAPRELLKIIPVLSLAEKVHTECTLKSDDSVKQYMDKLQQSAEELDPNGMDILGSLIGNMTDDLINNVDTKMTEEERERFTTKLPGDGD